MGFVLINYSSADDGVAVINYKRLPRRDGSLGRIKFDLKAVCIGLYDSGGAGGVVVSYLYGKLFRITYTVCCKKIYFTCCK